MALYKGSVRLAGIGSFPDQIQYMSQDDYNALSEEAKMNGTTYGIIGSAEPVDPTVIHEDISRYLKNHTFVSGSLGTGNIAVKDGYAQIKASGNPIQTLYINGINMGSQSHDANGGWAYGTPVRFYEGDVITGGSMDIYYQDD